MTAVTTAQLLRYNSKAKRQLVAAVVDNWHEAEKVGIATPRRIHQFLANIMVETGALTRLDEDLNYSAERLTEVWPGRFPTIAAARPYARNPKALAIKTYGSRLGNRSGTTDGWDFRGSGMMQTTGRDNFEDLGELMGLDLVSQPDLLRDPATAFRAACVEWDKRGCNAYADRGDTESVRRLINTGTAAKRTKSGKAIAVNGLGAARTFVSLGQKLWPENRPLSPVVPVATLASAEIDVIGEAPSSRQPAVIRDEGEAGDSSAPHQNIIIDPDRVAQVQKALMALGYVEAGSSATGDIGNATTAAVLAYRSERGLPLSEAIDEELFAQIAQDTLSGYKRPLSAARVDATTKDVASKIKEAGTARLVKIGAAAGAGVSGLGGVISAASDTFTTVRGWVQPFQDFFTDVPGWFWFGVVGVGSAVMAVSASKILDKIADAYRTGVRR